MANFTVTTLTDESDADASVASPGGTGLSLREAIALANANSGADDITFAAGLSGGTIQLTLGTLEVTGASLTINGDLGNDGTPNITITGDALGNDVHQSGSSTLTDVDASLATAVGGGNALSDNFRIINSSADLTVDGLILTGGNGPAGQSGGALRVVNDDFSLLTVQDSVVSGNYSATNGGAFGCSGDVVVDNSLISANRAVNAGGGMNVTWTVTVTDSAIVNNSAGGGGGGINSNFDDVTVTNTTISGNTAGSSGGGISVGTFGNVQTVTVINSTISGNNAGGSGDGIRAGNVSNVELVNSIVTGNPSSDISLGTGTLTLTGGNIVGTNVFSGSTDIGDTSASQVFASVSGGAGVLADNGGSVPTIALKADPSNPAIDAGSSGSGVPTTDVRGEARFDFEGAAHNGASITDLGAYETQGSLVVTTLADVVNASDGFTSLREALAFANANPGDDTITFDQSLNGTIRLDGGDGAGGTVGGTLSIAEAVTIDGDGRITISGDVNNNDTTVGTTDITDIAASTTAATLGDNVQIINATADLTLNGLTLTGGVTGGGGGAILGTNVTLTNATVSGNSAANSGGGILATTANLTNTTVSGNDAGTFGGGITASTVNLTNATVSGNSAGDGGGGIDATTANLTNAIVLGNDANADAEISALNSTMAGGNIVGDTFSIDGGSPQSGVTAADVFAATVDIDPGAGVVLAGVLADNGGPVETIALKLDATNPALDASNSSTPATDARGEARFDHAGIGNDGSDFADLGAYEAPELPSLVVTTLNDTVDAFDGLTSLREAIAFANGNAGEDTISFAQSLSGTIRLTDADGTLLVGEAVTIEGDGRITISGDVNNDDVSTNTTSDITDIFNTAATELDDNVRIINATAALTLDGLTLTGGVDDTGGGAVLSTADVTLTGTTVSGNSSGDDGGGISADTATLINSTVSGNSAGTFGGGISALTVNLTNSTVSGNSAVEGGGIVAFDATLINSTVSGNVADDDGGGIRVSTATLINSTVSGNSAGDDGGGIRVSTTANLTNSTVSGNSAGDNGGGIFASGSATVANSIVMGNLAASPSGSDEIAGTFVGGNRNIIGTNIFNGNDDIGDTTAAQVFADTVAIAPGIFAGVLADNGGPVETIALRFDPSNPAIDAGDDSLDPATDALGRPRYDARGTANNGPNISDLGAFEVQNAGVTVVGTAGGDQVDATHTPAGNFFVSNFDDTILGNAGGDRLLGLGGTDILNGGAGADEMDGGAGNDTFRIAGTDGLGDTFAGGNGTDKIEVTGASAVTLASFVKSNGIEQWDGNGKGVVGTSAANVLDFSGLAQVSGLTSINGLGGNDKIVGTAFHDTMRGGTGGDLLDGAAGNDTFQIASAEGSGDTLRGGTGTDTLEVLGSSKVTLSRFDATAASIETWDGNGKAIFGTSGANVLDFSGLKSVSGLTSIDGLGGNDEIAGSKLSETLIGGAGRDTLSGNGGSDVFDYNSISESRAGSSNRDKIVGFDSNDLIDLRTIDAKTGVSGNNAFTWIGKDDFTGDDPFQVVGGAKGQLRFNDNGATCTVQGDVNGDGKADFEILVHKSSLNAGDFLL